MLSLALTAKSPLKFHAKVIHRPRHLRMAVGATVTDGLFKSESGKLEKYIMCEYDHEPWFFRSFIESKNEYVRLLFYHIRIYKGSTDWWLSNMPVEVQDITQDVPEFELNCQTGFDGKDALFIFRVKVFCESYEIDWSEPPPF